MKNAMANGYYDPETLNMLRGVLDEVWDALPAERQTRMPKSEMAERILKRASEGERDRARLKAGGVTRRGAMDLLERAAEVLRQARKLPPGEARNELRQIAVALRWLAERPLSNERAKQIEPMLESWLPCKDRKRAGVGDE